MSKRDDLLELELEKFLKLKSSSISNVLKGTANTASGYIWKYK